MKLPGTARRGAVLLQTLVMSLLLAVMSVGITRWILNRHMTSIRTARSAESRTTAFGGAMYHFSKWGGGTAPAGSGNITYSGTGAPTRTMSYSYNSGTRVMTITYNEDQ